MVLYNPTTVIRMSLNISAVEKSGLKTLLENQKVSFEINQDKGRSSAANIKVIG